MLNPADAAFVEGLKQAVPELVIREDNTAYVTEPRGRYTGQGVVVCPTSTEQVAAVVRHCAIHQVGIVPFGGGTGTVAGQVKAEGPAPVILSLERMNCIRAVYPTENTLVCDAGCILADVQAAARDAGRLFALSLASEGSARIGGLLGTNAGGVNVLRYGNARAQVLGVEVVTATGEVWNGLTRLRKDNTGYDLRDLFIGAEGTLGIITGAALKLMPLPVAEGTALMVVPSPEAALDLLALAQARIGEGISAFEMIGRQGLEFLQEVGPEVARPFAEVPDWMVLIDLGLPEGGHPQDALEGLFEAAVEAGLVSDGVVAQNEAQRQAFWAIRENIPAANKRVGAIASHDISIPLSRIPDYIVEATAALQAMADVRVNCFGHLGDGNLHFNVFPAISKSRADYDHMRGAVQDCVHSLVHAYEGSISAEHGIGRIKVRDLERFSDPTKIALMRSIKAALDPLGIMNPGAVLAD